MTTRYLNIEEKHRGHAGRIASYTDFTTSPGEEIDAEKVLNNPNASLYCFNEATKNAIFTELPDGVNLASAPFVYLA